MTGVFENRIVSLNGGSNSKAEEASCYVLLWDGRTQRRNEKCRHFQTGKLLQYEH